MQRNPGRWLAVVAVDQWLYRPEDNRRSNSKFACLIRKGEANYQGYLAIYFQRFTSLFHRGKWGTFAWTISLERRYPPAILTLFYHHEDADTLQPNQNRSPGTTVAGERVLDCRTIGTAQRTTPLSEHVDKEWQAKHIWIDLHWHFIVAWFL